jgi:hypothetical protein
MIFVEGIEANKMEVYDSFGTLFPDMEAIENMTDWELISR